MKNLKNEPNSSVNCINALTRYFLFGSNAMLWTGPVWPLNKVAWRSGTVITLMTGSFLFSGT